MIVYRRRAAGARAGARGDGSSSATVLYNGYASTEVGPGTLATPSRPRAPRPGTVGRAVRRA